MGQILEVRDNEDFPADLLCLACARSDGVAYIRTTNLDGKLYPSLSNFLSCTLMSSSIVSDASILYVGRFCGFKEGKV